MAQTKTIQLLRSASLYVPTGSGAEAKTALENAKGALIALTGRKDGEIVLARYQESGSSIKSLLGIYHKHPDLPDTATAGWTFIQDITSSSEGIEHLQSELDATQTGAGLDTEGSYIAKDGDAIIGQSTSLAEAINDIADYIQTLDANTNYNGSSVSDDSKVIVAVKQVDGQVTSAESELSSVKVASVSGTNAAIAAEDTLGTALGKLQAQIDAMDSTVSTAVNNGDVITSISETNGVVTANKANMTDVLMTGYTKDTNATGAIAATDSLEEAFSKVENSLGAVTVKSTDKTVTIANNSGKDLSVNIDGTTLVKDGTDGTISANLTVVKLNSSEVTALSDANVKEAYKLIYSTDSNRTAIGDVVKVYKDSALKEVYLGDADDTVNSTTGAVTKYAYQLISDPTMKITAAAYDELTAEQKALYEAVDGQSLNYVYQLADGTYSIVPVDVSKFLSESEYGDGLQVVSGVVSVKKDANSGKVRTDDTPPGVTPGSAQDTGLVDVLTVSSNGVKVDNIQEAITYAVNNATGDLAVSAEGDNYITAAVDANNNKKINVTADVQNLTATAGTPGAYNSSTGAETTAPVAGTLSGVANSLGDAADIATKVKTYVDGAIAIEAARNDAKNKADIAALDGEALASTAPTAVTYSGNNIDEFQVLTRVNEVDGKVQTVDATANSAGSKSVTLKKVAATGAAADVSIADSGNLITATTVEGALQEIAGNLNAAKVVANDVITVDTSNSTTKLAVTTGNGLEKSSNTLQVKDGNGITVDSNGVSVNAGNGLEISSDAVAIKIDSTSAMATSSVGMLTVSSSGLKLNDTWDCGTF